MSILDLINKKNWKSIIKNLKDINEPIWNSNSLIHYAGLQNDFDLLELLIKYDAKLHKINGDGETILNIAAKNGYNKILKKIIDQDPKLLYNKDNDMNTPLHYLIEDDIVLKEIINNNKELDWSNLLNQVNRFYQTPLNNSIKKGIFNSVKFLFNNKDINFKKAMQDLPLFSLIDSQQFTSAQKIELINDYLKNDGDINLINLNGLNALLSAIEQHDLDLVKYLIKNKIDADYMSPVSTTHTLRLAYKYGIDNKDMKIFEYLLDNKKIDFTKKDRYNDTLGHYLLLFRSFLNKGDIDLEKKILQKMENFNHQNIDGNSILHLICSLNWKEYKDILLKHENILNIYNRNYIGQKPLDYINKKEHDQFLKIIAQNYKNNTNEKRDIEEIIKLIKQKKLPLDKLSDDLNKLNLMNDNKFITFSKFSASMLDVIIYSIYLLEKYKKILTAPIELNNFEKMVDLQLSSEINVQSDPYYSSSIFHFIIFWENKNKYYISNKLIYLIKGIIKRKKYKFIFMYLSLGFEESLHANVILMDLNRKTIERFDPYGGKLNVNVDVFLKDYFKSIKGFTYLGTSDYMQNSAYQTLSNEHDIHRKKIGDIGGFCLAWCVWYIELRINNDLPPKTLVQKSIKKMIKENKIFINFIRNYAHNLAKYLKKFYLNAKIDKDNLYNRVHSPEDQDKIKNHILKIFTSLN
ncbi:Ankyrin repeats (3 copies) [seawater metagenome]|uniref:Ankyrin repeats (3 copies) n=1 Tax=seawater metagenome TaxID=1561972 RepID=A0A5E8CM05_9ZZZZ